MAMWLAGMLGRYLSIHSGAISPRPSLPQRVNSKSPASAHCLHAGFVVFGHREHVVAAEDDAGRSPGRSGFSAKPASAMRELGGGDGHPRLAAHHLEALLDGLLALAFRAGRSRRSRR